MKKLIKLFLKFTAKHQSLSPFFRKVASGHLKFFQNSYSVDRLQPVPQY